MVHYGAFSHNDYDTNSGFVLTVRALASHQVFFILFSIFISVSFSLFKYKTLIASNVKKPLTWNIHSEYLVKTHEISLSVNIPLAKWTVWPYFSTWATTHKTEISAKFKANRTNFQRSHEKNQSWFDDKKILNVVYKATVFDSTFRHHGQQVCNDGY